LRSNLGSQSSQDQVNMYSVRLHVNLAHVLSWYLNDDALDLKGNCTHVLRQELQGLLSFQFLFTFPSILSCRLVIRKYQLY